MGFCWLNSEDIPGINNMNMTDVSFAGRFSLAQVCADILSNSVFFYAEIDRRYLFCCEVK